VYSNGAGMSVIVITRPWTKSNSGKQSGSQYQKHDFNQVGTRDRRIGASS